jgi:hypothetical protein
MKQLYIGLYKLQEVMCLALPPEMVGTSLHVTSLVLYGCRTWSLTVRKEHRLRVFEDRMLIFGPKRDEDVSWRK